MYELCKKLIPKNSSCNDMSDIYLMKSTIGNKRTEPTRVLHIHQVSEAVILLLIKVGISKDSSTAVGVYFLFLFL